MQPDVADPDQLAQVIAHATAPAFLLGAVSGFVAIWALLGYVRTHTYLPFVLYRLTAAATIVVLIVAGWRDATF